MTLLQSGPVVEQLLLVQLGPRFHQPSLAGGQRAGDQVNGVNAKDRVLVLPVGMEVRKVMLAAHLGEHADDDSKKATEFRHL